MTHAQLVEDRTRSTAASRGLVACLAIGIAGAASAQTRTWTTTEDFGEGTFLNVNADDPAFDQLQLNSESTPFPYINVAASGRGTIVRVNTLTGEILGEYRTAPEGRGRNPSRTTVDFFGNVWTGNRAENGGGLGSVVKVGIVIGGTRVNADGTPNPDGEYLAPPYDYNTCVDRDGDGLIRTSRGYDNVLGWPDVTDGVGGADGIVEDALDECILIYQRVDGDFIRHLSLDAENNVWVGGNFGDDNAFNLLAGETGAILAGFDVGGGGYGGLVDSQGVLWSANRGPNGLNLLRYDPQGTIDTADDTWDIIPVPDAYGLAVDSSGSIWHSQFNENRIRRYGPDGAQTGDFVTGGSAGDRGVAVTADDDIWVANSAGADVSRLSNDGVLKAVIPLGAGGQTPTGVAVDAAGKVWATCREGNSIKRIDPATDSVDLTVSLPGAAPYNYSDMTGSVLVAAIQSGFWSVVWDSGAEGTDACAVNWTSLEPDGTEVTVEVRAADTEPGLGGVPFVEVAGGEPIDGVAGRFYEIRVNLGRDSAILPSPVVEDISIGCIRCFEILDEAITCPLDDSGDVLYTFTFENASGVTAEYLLFPDPSVEPSVIHLDSVPGDGGQATVTVRIQGGLPGDEVCLDMILADAGFEACCPLREQCIIIPDCSCVQLRYVAFGCTDDATEALTMSLTLDNLFGEQIDHVFLIPLNGATFEPDYFALADHGGPVPTFGSVTLETVVGGVGAGDEFCFLVTTHDASLEECCASEFCLVAPDQETTGACCLPDGTCVVLDACDCESEGGVFAGAGTTCEAGSCTSLDSCPCDLDGDGVVGMGDVLSMLSVWGPCVACDADLDGNGIVGFDDLVALIAEWGPCE